MKRVGASRKMQLPICNQTAQQLQRKLSRLPREFRSAGRNACPTNLIERSGDFQIADLNKRRFGDRRSLFFVRNPSRQIDRRGGLGLLLRPRT